MTNLPTVIFSYRVDDILEEITKRTSKLGQMRGTEQEPFLVDRLSLTQGEDFMFSEFLEDAVSQTYDWLKAFGRKIPMYDKIVLKYDDKKMLKNCGTYAVEIDGDDKVLNDNIPMGEFVKLNNVSIVELFDMGKLHLEWNKIIVRLIPNQAEARIKASYRVTVNSIHNGKPTVKVLEATENDWVVGSDSNGIYDMINIPFTFIEQGVRHEIGLVQVELKLDAVPALEEPIKKDTYVEYHTDFSDDSVFDVYQTNVNCTTDNWMDYSCKLAIDPRDKIVFILENDCNMDMNLMSSIDRNIKEAMVNYIMWRWFEYSNPQEADRYYLKFESYASEAKNGMDSERKIVQRTYNINH